MVRNTFVRVSKILVQGREDIEIERTSVDYSNFSMTEIGQYTEESPGDVRGLNNNDNNAKCNQENVTNKLNW